MKRKKSSWLIGLTVFSTCLFTHSMVKAQTNIVQYNGNTFELWSPPADTIYIENVETLEREMKVSVIDSFPIKMNDIKIAGYEDVQVLPLPERSIDEYFIDFVNENKNLFNQLNDGTYILYARHFVVNEVGTIMYYKYDGVQESRNNIKITSSNNAKEIELAKLNINNSINELISSGKIKFEPAHKDGKKVLARANGARIYIKVKDHKANVAI